ncbi:hypothetical protein [Klenkia brasiliensis]
MRDQWPGKLVVRGVQSLEGAVALRNGPP